MTDKVQKIREEVERLHNELYIVVEVIKRMGDT